MKNRLLILILFLCFFTLTYSQISVKGEPMAYNNKYAELFQAEFEKNASVSNNGVYEIKNIDKERIKEEVSKIKSSCGGTRTKYYGREIDVQIDFFCDANKIVIDEGELYTLNIKSDAEGYQFLFQDFYLPEGCRLFFYNEERDMVLGAFTSMNNREDGKFVTQFINGGNVYIELLAPSTCTKEVKLMLDKVVYIYDSCFRGRSGIPDLGGVSDFCQINTSCSQGIGWKTEIKSVATILIPKGAFTFILNNYK